MAAETQQRHVIIKRKYGNNVYLSDFIKASYSEIILSWSPISSSKVDSKDYSSMPGQCSFVVANNATINGVSKFSKINYLVFADVEIYQNDVLIFWGTIEDLTNIGKSDVTVQCIGKDAELSKLFSRTIVNADDFPYAADEDKGKMLPVVYGEAKRVPFIGIDVAVTTKLTTSITKTGLYITGDDTSLFPSSGYIDIDDERISYTNIVSNVFQIQYRGYLSSVKAIHYAGAIIREVKSEYVYAVHGPVSAINDIYIGATKININNLPYGIEVEKYASGNHPTYPGHACIGITYGVGRNINTFSNSRSSWSLVVTTDGTDTQVDIEPADPGPLLPLSSAPTTDGDAWDSSLDTFYDSSVDGYLETNDITWGGLNYSEYFNAVNYRFIAFKFPNHIDNYTLQNHFCIKSSVSTSVYIASTSGETGDATSYTDASFVVEDGNAITDNVIPFIPPTGTSCPEWTAEVEGDWPKKFYNWTFVFWPDSDSADLYIYDTHRSFKAEILPEEEACPTECPWCDSKVELPAPPAAEEPDRHSAAFSSSTSFSSSNLPDNTGTAPAVFYSRDRVYADVDGIENSDSPPALIVAPEDIMADIITEFCGLTISKSHSTTGYEQALVISQRPDVRALLARIALQSKSFAVFTPSGHVLKKMTSLSTDAVISASDIFQNQAWINYTNKADIVNQIEAAYNYYWWGLDAGKDTVSVSDSTSQTTYGVNISSENYPYIPGVTQAGEVAAWRLASLKDPRLKVEFMGTLTNNINRKVGDVITFDTTDSDLDDLLAEIVSSTDKFLVLDIVYQPDGVIRIETIGI